MNTELLSHAQEYIEKMANGINPINNEKVKNDDSLNNIRISRCLFYVNSILKDVLKKETKNHKPTKLFYLTKEQLNIKYIKNKWFIIPKSMLINKDTKEN